MVKGINFIILFLLILSFCQVSLANNSEDKDLEMYINDIMINNDAKRYNAVFNIHNYGKDAIPFLIEKIDTDKKSWTLVKHPNNSFVFKEALTNYVGVLYAYVVELILGKDRLLPNKTEQVIRILGDNNDNYIYWNGIIDCKGRRTFNMEDMKEIKQTYESWWHKNKTRSIEELRTDWKNDIKPLTGSDYWWG